MDRIFAISQAAVAHRCSLHSICLFCRTSPSYVFDLAQEIGQNYRPNSKMCYFFGGLIVSSAFQDYHLAKYRVYQSSNVFYF